jgi:hypothetical protein
MNLTLAMLECISHIFCPSTNQVAKGLTHSLVTMCRGRNLPPRFLTWDKPIFIQTYTTHRIKVLVRHNKEYKIVSLSYQCLPSNLDMFLIFELKLSKIETYMQTSGSEPMDFRTQDSIKRKSCSVLFKCRCCKRGGSFSSVGTFAASPQ